MLRAVLVLCALTAAICFAVIVAFAAFTPGPPPRTPEEIPTRAPQDNIAAMGAQALCPEGQRSVSERGDDGVTVSWCE